MCQDQLGQLKTGAHLQEMNEAGQLAGQSFIYRKYKITYKKGKSCMARLLNLQQPSV